MADPFQRLIGQFAESHLIGLGSDAWNSNNPEARQLIRSSAAKKLHIEGPEVADLSKPPRPEKWSLSISHTHAFGGWVAAPRPLRVGFDVEMAARIKPVTIARISSPREIDEAPDSRFLWCAKESVYKALENEQPDAVTRLHIQGWNCTEEFWHFTCEGYARLKGVVLRADGLVFAVCTIS